MEKKWLLITVFNKEILVDRFDTFEAAQNRMHTEMTTEGRIPEKLLEDYGEYECIQYGFEKMGGFSEIGMLMNKYIWKIVSV